MTGGTLLRLRFSSLLREIDEIVNPKCLKLVTIVKIVMISSVLASSISLQIPVMTKVTGSNCMATIPSYHPN